MMVRLHATFATGWIIFFAVLLFDPYDGAVTILFLPILTTIATAIGLTIVYIIGSSLLIDSIWQSWKTVGWRTLGITFWGLVAIGVAWLQFFTSQVTHPETDVMVTLPNPYLFVGGGLMAMFGVAFCPEIGAEGRRTDPPSSTV